MTKERLARILHEEFEKGSWGDIDPYLFKMVADGRHDSDDAEGLANVLSRVLTRLEAEEKA